VAAEDKLLGFKLKQEEQNCDWTCNVLGHIYPSLYTALNRAFAGFKFGIRVCDRLLVSCPRNPEFATGNPVNFGWLLLTSSDKMSLAKFFMHG